ncbi:hypothetical protein D3H65_04265 [Paraflavitalea soli]|uniref:Uncharacterized protein n=1 Tax=Paraflavitalea soli TaxID=2315862 RepID=A0A3B7MJM1_9BACT|nr:hypothetical protein [Paraflavitalea soli]AXY73236.1 hypothetical protein D3H65_04265 [Paraflavitalea soli]
MKEKHAIVLIFLILLMNGIFAQKIIKEQYEDFYVTPQNDSVFTMSYIVQNNTKENMYLWFDGEKSSITTEDVRRYFYLLKGDVTLLEILNDESVSNKKLNIIGQTFIKFLAPKRQFRISITMHRLDSGLDDAVKQKLVIVKSSLLDMSLKRSLDRNNEFSFGSDMIIISDKGFVDL